MDRRLLAFLLTLCMVLGMVPATAFADGVDTAEQIPRPTATATETGKNITVSAVEGLGGGVATDTALTFTMNFAADKVTTSTAAMYGDWLVDYVIKVNKNVCGDDAYLAGQYNFWGEDWVKIASPGEAVILQGGKPLKVLGIAGIPGIEYNVIYNIVEEFNCGIFFTDKYLTENPDLEVSLTLMMYYPSVEEIEAGTATSFAIGKPYVFKAADVLDAKIDNVGYFKLEDALKEVTSGSTITLLRDIEITEKWDRRNNGATITSDNVVIDGNGKTLKFTGDVINDGYNNHCVFRVEGNNVTFSGLTFDMSEASGSGNWLRAISSKAGDLTVEDCTFIGNPNVTRGRGIIFGEGSGDNPETDIIIRDSKFVDWRYGVTDNENGKDMGSVIMTGNTLTNSGVQISASKTITFTGNTVEEAYVTITTHTKSNELLVVAIDNELEENDIEGGLFNKIAEDVSVEAQDEFALVKAIVGDTNYFLFSQAVEAATSADAIILTYDVVIDQDTVVAATIDQQKSESFDGYKITLTAGTKLTVASDDLTVKTVDGYNVVKDGTEGTFTYTSTKIQSGSSNRPSSKPSSKPTTPAEPTISTDSKTEENAAGDQVTTTETTVKPETTVTGSTAKTEISESAANKIVETATKSESSSVVITPEVDETKDVDKVEVTIAASTVEKIGTETDANLTVSTPVADVEIANAGLNDLAKEGEKVTVSAEKKDDTIVVEVKADNKNVDKVSGGLTVTIPQEEVSAGTVAVIVHEDGTEEIVRQTVGGENALTIPLDGSATIKIVDNSKDFDDVEDTDWHSDAVDFAASRELFNGTSKTTFSPSGDMTRGMLAMVLHNLENNPESETENDFDDVQESKYYAGAVSWAAEKGLVSGYANGGFGPEDKITREQLAVILWKYAGCPESDHELDFEDEANIAGYAKAALQWANEHKIINGKGSGKLDPSGNATRAEVAQMLKNFMENTKK